MNEISQGLDNIYPFIIIPDNSIIQLIIIPDNSIIQQGSLNYCEMLTSRLAESLSAKEKGGVIKFYKDRNEKPLSYKKVLLVTKS